MSIQSANVNKKCEKELMRLITCVSYNVYQPHYTYYIYNQIVQHGTS